MKRLLLTTAFLFVLFSGFSQYSKEIKRAFLDGEYFLAMEAYKDALEGYMKVYKVNPDNANINYRIGLCYLNIPGKKERAIPYLEKAVKNITQSYKEGNIKEEQAPPDAWFFLGDAYFLQYRLDDAKKCFEKYLTVMTESDSLDVDYVKQQIAAVDRTRDFMAHPVAYKLENLGKTINNAGENFDAVVSGDESTLVYVSSLKFYDAVFYSQSNNGQWQPPRNITPEIQSDGDLYPAGISYDGKTLYLSKSDRFNSDIYVSHLENGKWTKAEKIEKNINTKYWESSATLSPDGKTLYFTSNKKDSRGGLDIYVSHWDETLKMWGIPENLGPVINTKFNEETPFFSKDGKTLYFSSQGHNSMGGFDIFYSEKKADGSWSKPVNIGYPINTTDDDLFFVPIVAKIYGYYSMFDPETSLGDRDIYRVEFYSDLNPRPVTIAGKVTFQGQQPGTTPSGKVKVEDEQGRVVAQTPINEDGTFSVTEKIKGNYNVVVEADNYKTRTNNITIPEDYSVGRLNVNVAMEPVAVEKIMLPVIFFGFDKYEIAASEKAKVDELISMMKKYPEVTIVLTGYADSRGPAFYNKRLSLKRAKAVATLLEQSGISSSRITVEGAGETNFLAINKLPNGKDCPKGRAFNRRVEVSVSNAAGIKVEKEKIEIPAELRIK
jgi:outer membrane protein OmpA-like peptidoglycan-associated protein/tetratricopeptide (TPR) repeat protein